MKTLLLDFGGTLDADGVTWLERFFPLYLQAGVSASREEFDKAFYAADDDLSKKHALSGLGFEETLRLQVQTVLGTLAPGRAGLGDGILRKFLDDCRSHFRRNRPVLERLRRGRRLGIVSNYYGNLESCLRAEGIRDLFDFVADSGAVGSEKPAPDIFLAALRGLGSTVAQALMVGDSIPRDMRGAEGLGLAHAWISPNGTAPCCPEAWRISSLLELEARLG